MEENTSLVVYKKRLRDRKGIMAALAVICVLTMVLGSAYVGGLIALHNASDYMAATVASEHNEKTDGNRHVDVNISVYEEPDIAYGMNVNEAANPEEPVETEDAATQVGLTNVSNQPLTLPELFEGANPAVVAISTSATSRNRFGQSVDRPSSGSGFIISAHGYVVTNYHVIENASNITVILYDGTEHDATVVGNDPSSDISVLRIDVTNSPFLVLGDSDNMRVGDQVAAIGNPLGQLANSMTVGVVSALNRNIQIEGQTRTKMQTDAAVNRGNSGGPLLNLRGEVIGIVNAKSIGMDVEGLGFVIPSNQAKQVIDELIEYGFTRGRAILGVTIQTIDRQDGQSAVQIIAVTPGGAADRAGLRDGDIIVAAASGAISTFTDLRDVLDDTIPGEPLELTIRRFGDDVIITVYPDEYRPDGI